MIRHESHCVGCPKEMGCLGSACPYNDVLIMECDECGKEVDELYEYKDKLMCWNCFINQLEMVEDDWYLVDGEKIYVDDLDIYRVEVSE